PCVDCTLLLQRRYVAQDRLARTSGKGGHRAHIVRAPLVPAQCYRQPDRGPVGSAPKLAPQRSHNKAFADDADTSVVFIRFASALSTAPLFVDRDEPAAAILATAIFNVHRPFSPRAGVAGAPVSGRGNSRKNLVSGSWAFGNGHRGRPLDGAARVVIRYPS